MNEPDDIDALFAAERARPEPGPAIKSAVAAKVATAIGAPALGGVAAATAARAGTGVMRKVALGVLAGGILGGTLVAVAMPPRVIVETRVERVEVPVPLPPSSIPTAIAPPPSPSLRAPALVATTPAVRPSASTTTADRDTDLARERALVDRARSALARGDSTSALAAADEHQKSFPQGQLAEEREVVAIQALASGGRSEDAANRAGAFRKAYPGSLLLPIVDAALRPR